MHVINGQRTPGTGPEFVRCSPATGAEVARYRLASPADVDAAVTAAAEAFPGWKNTTPGERSDLLFALAAGLEARAA